MNFEIYDDETLAGFLAAAPNPTLVTLVERLVARTKAQGFWSSTCVVIGEPTAKVLGFDPLAEPPDWAWRHEHGQQVELGLILDDFTWIILVPSESPLAADG